MIIDSSVRERWLAFNEALEGRTPFLHLDLRGFLSVGVGNLVDATAEGLTDPTDDERQTTHDRATQLPWLRSDGSPANPHEVAEECDRVKARTDLAFRGAGAFRPPVTRLHLENAEIDRLAASELERLPLLLVARPEFANVASWPADAQLALLSIAFKWGADFRAPELEDCLATGDFAAAATVSTLNPDIGPYFLRNQRSRRLFTDAAAEPSGPPASTSPNPLPDPPLPHPPPTGPPPGEPSTDSGDPVPSTVRPSEPDPSTLRPTGPDQSRSAAWPIP